MKRVASAFLFFLLLGSAWAQSTIPGTFNTPTQSVASVSAPLLTPPVVSYGAGVNGSPAIVSGQPTVPNIEATSSETATTNRGFITAGGYVPMPRAGVATRTETSPVGTSAGSRTPFDFIRASGAGGTTEIASAGVGDTNLGQTAASLRKGPPPTQRKFSNDDIARINSNMGNKSPMPGASTDQPPYPQPQPEGPPHSDLGSAPLPPGAKPSPFSPRPIAMTNATTPEQPKPSEPTQLAQNTMPPQPASDVPQNSTQSSVDKEQQAQTAAPSSAQATQRQLPASGSLLPFFAMLGGAATLAGYVLTKRR